jgi:hypothetical protein
MTELEQEQERELLRAQLQRLLRAVSYWRRTNKMKVMYSHPPASHGESR